MMKRVGIVSVVVVLMLALGGCGGGSKEESGAKQRPRPVNHAPIAAGASVEARDDGSYRITLHGSDPDGDALSYRILTPPSHGRLQGSAPVLRYLPEAGFTGEDRFTYSVSDGKLDSDPAEVTIRVKSKRDDHNRSRITLPPDLRHALAYHVVPYDRITLEVNATSALRLTAVNDTLAKEHNRTLTLHGHKNDGRFYLYNLPLVPGENLIRLQATDSTGKTTEANLTLRADANRCVPIAMRASRYEGIKRLDTVVEVGTDLNALEYLFDLESDGTIETVQSEGNFSLHLTEEGRYRPRVTIRTKEGLLYSSGPYALALDVKADASQKDPKGATPLDVAKRFVQTIEDGDTGALQRYIGEGSRYETVLYDPKAIRTIGEIYTHIKSWDMTYNNSGDASVTFLLDINGTEYGGGFELRRVVKDVYTGKFWYIDFLY